MITDESLKYMDYENMCTGDQHCKHDCSAEIKRAWEQGRDAAAKEIGPKCGQPECDILAHSLARQSQQLICALTYPGVVPSSQPNEEEERKKFEVWANNVSLNIKRRRDNPHTYADQDIWMMWCGWIAHASYPSAVHDTTCQGEHQ